MSIYHFEAQNIKGEEVSLSDYAGKVLVVVNTASKCGFTPQYTGLQELYEQYRGQGLEILGFPCNQFGEQEPGSHQEVEEFCQLNFGVTFPLFAKVDVRGADAHPLFAHITEQVPFAGFDSSTPGGARMQGFLQQLDPARLEDNSVKWNFTKFLIDREGRVVGRFESTAEPQELKQAIEALL